MKKYIGLITVLLPLFTSAQLVMTNSYYVVLSGGSQSSPTTLVLTNPAPAGISNTGSGWIISENEFNQVDWQIGASTGTYVVPFGYGTSDYLPVTCQIAAAGSGNGSIKFATYHGATWDNVNYEPSDVTTMSDYGAANYSNNAVDRFWIVDATGYGTMPSPDITFTYIRSGGASEIAAPNYIVDSTLVAQRFNTSASQWDDWLGATHTGVVSANTGTVSSGAVTPANFYRSWCIVNDSILLTPTGVATISNNATGAVTVYPNPGNGQFNIVVSGKEQGASEIQVYDVLGQQLYRHPLITGNNQIQLSSEANGVYLYRVISDNGNLLGSGKLVVQK